MALIAFATNAVQFTPFSPIDETIMKFESSIHIDLLGIMTWTAQHPHFKKTLVLIYNTLPYQMSILPLLLLGMGHFTRLKAYYFLLLFSLLLGFLFYYFFPTTAPASQISSDLFATEQIATGAKFSQIHQHISPTTIDGGLIAFPSFHCIWALLCVYLLIPWPVACLILFCLNLLLILSCVLLGWHYPSDILGSLIVLLLSYLSFKRFYTPNR